MDCQSDELCDSGICNTKGGQGTSCMDQNQCAKGYICQGGECYLHFVPVGGGGSQDTCKTDTDCPSGSQCLNNQCIPNNSCLHDADCPPGHYCDMGLCRKMPETDPHKDGVIDVSGMWYTQYSFDMTNALIGFPKLGGPLDKLDQLFKNGFNLKNKIPIIGDIIDKAVANYLKSRFKSGIPEVITALNNIANMLQTWKAKGEMQLRHLNPRNKISGTENWNSLILYWIDQCPMGRADPNYPQCAELDVGFKHADVKIEVFPFTGSVSGNTFNMDNRKIKMEVNKLISYLVNLVIKVTTGHPDLKTMLKKSIDCTEVQKAVEGLACSIGYCGSLQFVQIACNQAKDPVADLIGAKIDSLKSSDNVLEFSGYAQIVSDNNQPPQSLEMKNGVLNGKAKVVSSGKTTGDWSATR